MIASIGVTDPENGSLASATEGDCNGDCMEISLFAEASIMSGGRSGVDAKLSSGSSTFIFAFSMSIAIAALCSSRPSNKLLVGVGGSGVS